MRGAQQPSLPWPPLLCRGLFDVLWSKEPAHVFAEQDCPHENMSVISGWRDTVRAYSISTATHRLVPPKRSNHS